MEKLRLKLRDGTDYEVFGVPLRIEVEGTPVRFLVHPEPGFEARGYRTVTEVTTRLRILDLPYPYKRPDDGAKKARACIIEMLTKGLGPQMLEAIAKRRIDLIV